MNPTEQIIVTPEVTEYFRSSNFFQARTWKDDPVSKNGYQPRWKNGDVIHVIKGAYIEEHVSVFAGKNIHTIGSFSMTAAPLPIGTVLGRYCSIAQGLRVTGFRHPIDAVTCSHVMYRERRESVRSYFADMTKRDGISPQFRMAAVPQPSEEPIIIGHDVWIGDNVVLRGDSTIGNGAIIAAHSVVTKSVPPYEIWGGNPARFIRKRFPDEICQALEEIQWWDYELADLYLMDLDKPAKFIENFAQALNKPRRFLSRRRHVYDDLKAIAADEH